MQVLYGIALHLSMRSRPIYFAVIYRRFFTMLQNAAMETIEDSTRLLRQLTTHPEIVRVAGVLRALAARGITDLGVASGFMRTLVLAACHGDAHARPTDIDVHYTGTIPTAQAEVWLREILTARGIAPERWDIWNFREHDAAITSTAYGYRVHFVSTIDTIYLSVNDPGVDPIVHDLTGRGVADARMLRLEMPHLDVLDYAYSAAQLCYLSLEGCRRMALHQLTPTPRVARELRANASLWQTLAPEERDYLWHRARTKLSAAQREAALPLYAAYGWEPVLQSRGD